MFSSWRSNPIPLVGIDISSAAVKIMELAKVEQGYRVENYILSPLPQGAVVEKTIKDSEAVIKALSSAISHLKIRAKGAVIAVADSLVISKIVIMDASLSEEDMEAQISFEADKHIPYPLNEVSLDFSVLRSSAKDPGSVDVLLIASRSENVENRAEVVNTAGIDVRVVEVESQAVERAFSLVKNELIEQGTDKIIAVVDIGETTTNLIVLDNMSVVFTREELFGGQRLVEEIQQRYGLSLQEVEQAKREGTLPQDYLTEVLEPFKDTTILQVRRALQFFFSSSQHNHVDQLVLTGGIARVPGLFQSIQEQMGVPTLLANPFVNMEVASHIDVDQLNNDASMLLICCGLAMRVIH